MPLFHLSEGDLTLVNLEFSFFLRVPADFEKIYMVLGYRGGPPIHLSMQVSTEMVLTSLVLSH